jgi:hypothetical protein
MTRRLVILTTAIVLAGLSVLEAGQRSYLTTAVGRTFVHKPDVAKEYVDDGHNALLGVGFDFTPWLAMHVAGEYHIASTIGPREGWLSGDIKVKCAFIWLKASPYTFESLFAPYGIAGIGYAYADKGKSAEATTFGLGADFWVVRRIGVFLEWRRSKAFFSESDVECHLLEIGVICTLAE